MVSSGIMLSLESNSLYSKLGKIEEQLPNKPVGQLLVNSRSQAGDCHPTDNQQTADSHPTNGQQTVNLNSIDIQFCKRTLSSCHTYRIVLPVKKTCQAHNVYD